MAEVESDETSQLGLREPSAFVKAVVTLSSSEHTFDELLKTVYKYFSYQVGRVYPPSSDPVEQQEPRKEIYRDLLTPLVECYCGEVGLTFMEFFKKNHIPTLEWSHRCNYVFSHGDATYSCRECAADSTCVFCSACFEKSAHKHHKYKVSTSGGSGYCDCGDPEAWKTDPYCPEHQPEKSLPSHQTVGSVLPEGAECRWRRITECLLNYITDVLLNVELPATLLEERTTEPLYQCVLFNDEIHSYENVISAVTSSLKCNLSIATRYVTRVDRVGRATVYCGSEQSCNFIRDEVARHSSQQSIRPLRVCTIESYTVAHQYFAQALVEWLAGSVLKECPLLLPVFCEILMNSDNVCCRTLEFCWAQELLTGHAFMWKTCRIAVQHLIMSTLLKESRYRKQFSVLFLRLYPNLLNSYINDDHNHSVCAISLTVQVFTAFDLIRHHNALAVLFKALYQCSLLYQTTDGTLSFRRELNLRPVFHLFHCFTDLGYLLRGVPMPEQWDELLRVGFLKGYRALSPFFKSMQDVEQTIRYTGAHIEWEPMVETAHTMTEFMVPMLQLLQQWVNSDDKVGFLVLKRAIQDVDEYLKKQKFSKELVHFGNAQELCITYKSSESYVSFFFPLQRMLAGFYLNVPKYETPFSSWSSKIDPAEWIHMAVRVQVCCAEINCGMWKRNGHPALYHEHSYRTPTERAEMLDKDILLLQIGASLMRPDQFIIQLIYAFRVHQFLRRDYKEENAELEALMVQLTEHLLQLLIYVLGERWMTNVGMVAPKEGMRRAILHILCMGPTPFSKISRSLSAEDNGSESAVQEIISSVATYRPPTSSSAGTFLLKEELLCEYNPFFYHYDKKDFSIAEKVQATERKEKPCHIRACPPPPAPPFTPLFQPVLRLFSSDSFLELLLVIFKRAKDASNLVTEGQIHRALFLVGMALNEEWAQLTDCATSECVNFTERAIGYQWGDVSLIQLIESVPPGKLSAMVRSLLEWTVTKFKSTVKQRRKRAGDLGVADSAESFELANDEEETSIKRQKKEMAMLRRQQVMAHIMQMQQSFQSKNHSPLEESSQQAEGVCYGSETRQLKGNSFPVCLGPSQSETMPLKDAKADCVLCQETSTVALSRRVMVYAAFVQESSLYRDRKAKDSGTSSWEIWYSPADMFSSVHISTCGHAMHNDCWNNYIAGTAQMDSNGAPLWRSSICASDPPEYLCPFCKRICNTVIPLLPSPHSLHPSCMMMELNSYEKWKQVVSKPPADMDKCRRSGMRNMALKIQWLKGSGLQPRDIAGKGAVAAAYPYDNDVIVSHQVRMERSIVTTWSGQDSDESSSNDSDGEPNDDFNAPTPPPMEVQHPVLADYYHHELVNGGLFFHRSVYSSFLSSICSFGFGIPFEVPSCYVVLTSLRSIAYTLRSIEGELEYEGKALFGAFSVKQRSCLSALPRAAAFMSKFCSVRQGLYLFHNLIAPFLCRSADRQEIKVPSVVEMDLFSSLVELTCVLPSLGSRDDSDCVVPTSGVCEHHLLRLVLSAFVLQSILACSNGYDGDANVSLDPNVLSEDEQNCLFLFEKLALWLGNTRPVQAFQTSLPVLTEAIRKFLRLVTLFHHSLTLIPPPEALKDPRIRDDLQPICRYLDIPGSLSILLDWLDKGAMEKWCKMDKVRSMLAAADLPRYPIVKPTRLLKLPPKYDDLIVAWSSYRCPSMRNVDSMGSAALCLVCGSVVCSQAYCCKNMLGRRIVSACFYHSWHCSSGVNVYLCIRTGQVHICAPGCRACSMAAPYVDEYGETDEGLRRGNPLFLNETIYETLQKEWLFHSIPEMAVKRAESAPQGFLQI